MSSEPARKEENRHTNDATGWFLHKISSVFNGYAMKINHPDKYKIDKGTGMRRQQARELASATNLSHALQKHLPNEQSSVLKLMIHQASILKNHMIE